MTNEYGSCPWKLNIASRFQALTGCCESKGLTLLWLAWPCVCVFDGGNDEHQVAAAAPVAAVAAAAAAAAAVDVSVVEIEDGIPDIELLTVVVAPAAAAVVVVVVADENGGDVSGGNSLTVQFLKT